jgi:hypothetical protein
MLRNLCRWKLRLQIYDFLTQFLVLKKDIRMWSEFLGRAWVVLKLLNVLYEVLLEFIHLDKVVILLSKFFFRLSNQKYYILNGLRLLQVLVQQAKLLNGFFQVNYGWFT